MKTDTLLNLYQSYTLTKVSELNKQSLIALYAQNEQLGQLNEELARANRTSEQILRNQIKEIEQKEKRRYFKNMTFNLSQALDLLENEENANFRIFASGLFLSPIRDMAKNAVQELEEIADKEYAQNIVKRTTVFLDKDISNIDNYNKTSWASLLTTKSKIEDEITKEIRRKKAEIASHSARIKDIHNQFDASIKNNKGCLRVLQYLIVFLFLLVIGTLLTHDYEATYGVVIILVIVLLLLWWLNARNRRNRSNYWGKIVSEEKIVEKQISPLSEELKILQQEEIRLTTQYNELLQDITADCPKWESKLSEIAELIPHEEKKTIGNKDPLLTEAAKLVVKEKDASTSLIQRKFAIGYTRAGRIMNQLEALSIVGPANGSKAREIYCESEEDLSELIKC